jgi:ABC-2 type transport system ATP-binding protein
MTKSLIGVAPQENLLYKNLSCEENLKFFAQIYGVPAEKIKAQIYATLRAVNLLDKAKKPIDTLSGGMQRRMNIAVAMIHHPKLLILDEPTTGLDIETRYEIWELIQNLSRGGMTILLTTHLLDEAQRLCQRIGILKAGTIIAQGTLSELRQRVQAKEIIILETPEREKAIARGQALGFTPRYYGQDLAFWLPEPLELKEIISHFEGIHLDCISRQCVQLEHIYLEVMMANKSE